jgi:aspartate/methionine/tyrosine aminotransferase
MRQAVLNLEESMIRQVANAGMGRSDVLKFWFGESDEVTPQFIRDAAISAMQRGETFYAQNLGLPELREAIAGYTKGIRAQGASQIGADRIAVTSGGVNALMLAVQAVVDSGACPLQPTTVVDYSGDEPQVLRQGRGSLARLGL